MKRLLLPLTLFLSTAAAAQGVKPEDAINHRQNLFQVLLWDYMPMGAMVRGQIPFDAKAFAKHALRVSNIAGRLIEGFPQGSHEGGMTDAKAEIWENWADFEKRMKAMQTQTRTLYQVARGGDEAAIKAQFGKTSQSCKDCHDTYRAD